MASIGSVELELRLNRTAFNKELKALGSTSIPKLSITPALDVTAFKQRIKAISIDDCVRVNLCADIKGFTQTINRETRANRPQIEVQLNIENALHQLEEFKTSISKQVSYINLALQYPAFRGEARRTEDSARQTSRGGGGASGNTETNKLLTELIKETKKNRPGDSLFASIKQGVGNQIGGGLLRGFNRGVGKDISAAVQVPIKAVLDSTIVKSAIKDAGALLETIFTKASYAVGDGLVAAIESESTPLKAFLETTFDTTNINKGIAETRNEIEELGKTYRKAIEEIELSGEALAPIDKAIRARRERALDDRALPLVKARSGEILADKKVKNTGKVVDENTKELFIAVSGYAKARGLAGARIAKQLNQELPKNSKAIYVKNADSDIDENTPKDQNLLAIGKSLAKPNLRGYSKDAVEVASQAYAAFKKNPEIRIKLIGESGGGYVAEEATRILQKLGIKNVDYIGIGTPNLIGRLDPDSDKNKILSPDEHIGNLTKKFLERAGIADAKAPAQNILGAPGHNFENYRGISEVQRFINPPRVKTTPERVADLKQLGAKYAQTDFKKQSPEELKKLAAKAFYDLQVVKNSLFAAEGDLKKELADVAKVLQNVYVRAANEPPQILELRLNLDRTNDFLDVAINLPIEQATELAAQVAAELRSTQKEFSNSVGKERIGTIGAKFDSVEAEVEQLINTLTLPVEQLQLALKQRHGQPPRVPLPIAPIVPVASPKISELTQIKNKFTPTIDKAKLLEVANPTKSKAYANAALENVSRAIKSVDQEILKLTPTARTGSLEGTQLANLKSQLSRIENDSTSLLHRLETAITDPLLTLLSTIETQSIEGISTEEIAASYKAQIKALGNQFSAKGKLVTSETFDGAEVALEIERDLAKARNAIDAAVLSLGNNADASLKAIAKAARAKITTASKKTPLPIATNVEISPASFKNVTAGAAVGIALNLPQVERAGVEMAQALTEGFEGDRGMRIESPSKKMIANAGLIIKGLLIGLNSGATQLVNAGVATAEQFNQGFNSRRTEANPVDIVPPATNLRTQIAQIEGFRTALNGIPERLNEINPLLGSLYTGAVNVAKGFLLFTSAQAASQYIGQLVTNSVKAIVTLDRLATAISFASGGSKQGADNLKFVGEEVDRLKIPLAASQEGFSKLAAATRGTAVAGQATRDIFTGMSEAATVLGLTTDQTNRGLTALTQIASKGVVSSEELRQQLAESGLSGAMGIAARAMGVTEAQLNKLLETGRVMSSDFLPKFGQQLTTEFGGAALTASGNLQSALFNVENTNLKLQQSFGGLISPAVITGANALAAALEYVTEHGKELLITLASITFTIGLPLIKPMLIAIAKLPIMAALIVGLRQAFGNLRGVIKQVALEFVLIHGALTLIETAFFFKDGGPLQKQFSGLSEAADNAREKIKGVNKELAKPIEPTAANSIDHIIIALNRLTRFKIETTAPDAFKKKLLADFDSGKSGEKLTSYADIDAVKTAESLAADTQELLEFSKDITQLATPKKPTINPAFFAIKGKYATPSDSERINELPGVDTRIEKLTNAKRISDAQIARDFTNKGLNIPAEIKTSTEKINQEILKTSRIRTDITKPYADKLAGFQQFIERAKSDLIALGDPLTARAFGDPAQVKALTSNLSAAIPVAEKARDALVNLLASNKVDPVLAFSDAFKKLNKELAKVQENAQAANLASGLQLAKSNLAAFGKEIDASFKTAVAEATIERDKISSDLKALSADFLLKSKELESSRFKPTLDRFKLTPKSTVSDVQAAIDAPGTTDADKNLLEQIKTVPESGIKVKETRKQLLDSDLKLLKVGEETALGLIKRRYDEEVAVTKVAENQKTIAVKTALTGRKITAEDAAVQLGAIAINSTKSEIARTKTQQERTLLLYSKGILSAEKFAEQERTLIVTQSDLKKQLAEDEFNYREQLNAQTLASFEELNAKIAALVASQSTQRQNALKQLQLNKGIDSEGVKVSSDSNALADAQGRIKVAKEELSNNQKLEALKAITPKTALANRRRINQDLLAANGELLSAQITQEETFRAQVENSYNRRFSKLELLTTQAQTKQETAAFDLIKNATTPVDLKSLELKSGDEAIKNRRAALIENNKILNEQIAALPKSGLVGNDFVDKQTDLYKKLAANAAQYLQVEKDEFASVQNQAIDLIDKRLAAQKNATDRTVGNLEAEKEAYSLINSSLDRSRQLLESRSSVSKAISDAAVASLEVALEAAPDTQKQQLSVSLQNAKVEALRQEQVYGNRLLELDSKRQKLSAQMAISEAEIAQSRSLIAQLEAVGELEKAAAQNDERAIASAQTKLDLQNKIVAATDKQLENAQANLAIQDELAGNASSVLSIQQQSALNQAAATSNKASLSSSNGSASSSNAGAIDNSSGKKPKQLSLFEQSRQNMFAPQPIQTTRGLPPEYFNLKAETQKAATNSISSTSGGMSAEAQENAALGLKPGESVENLLKRQLGLDPTMSAEAYDKLPKSLFYGQDTTGTLEELNKKYAPKANSLGQLQEMYKPKANSLGQLQEMYKPDARNLDELNKKYAPKENTSAQFSDSLKMANKGIEERLDKLNSSLATAVNSPRNLYVSSPEPVSDAVSILADINRMNTQSSGLG